MCKKSRFLMSILIMVFLFTGMVNAAPKKITTVEDQVVINTSTGIHADWVECVIPEFKDYIKTKYGKNVDVIVAPGAIAQNWTKLEIEWPKPSGDLYVLYKNLIAEGAKAGYWEKMLDYYTDEELAPFNKTALEAHGGYSIANNIHFWGPVVRKDLIPIKFNSWSDFAEPKIKGRMTFDSALLVGSGSLSVLAAGIQLGADWEKDWVAKDGTLNKKAIEPTMRLVRKWYENSLTLTEGSGTIRPLLQRGETMVSAWWSHQALAQKEAGYNVEFIFPKEGTIAWGFNGYVIPKTAKHKNLAIEFHKFLLSKRGYELAYKRGIFGFLIPRSDVEIPAQEKNFQPPANLPVVAGYDFYDWLEKENVHDDFIDMFVRIVIQGQ